MTEFATSQGSTPVYAAQEQEEAWSVSHSDSKGIACCTAKNK